MSLRVETDLLRRILTASLPAGARAAELFIESRIGLDVNLTACETGSDPMPQNERRWETGAHLRRFSEGRHESFVLDAPSPEALEALALHPEAVALEWLGGPPGVGISRERKEESAREARLSDASPTAEGGPWSDRCLTAADELLREWLALLESQAASAGLKLKAGASLHVHLQEILVVATDRDPARDTRSFVEAKLKARVTRGDQSFAAEETLRAISLPELITRSRARLTGQDSAHPATRLLSRCLSGLTATAAPRGEMPVVFASPSGGFLLHEIRGHLLEADHVLRGASPFAGSRGQAIASPLLSMSDDGSLPGMGGSALFDDEGVSARRTPLLIEGTLVGYLSDRLTAVATDGISTGNGRRQSYRDAPMPRMTNLVIDAGTGSLDQILSDTPTGLLVNRLGRGSVDPATGRFVLALEEAYIIERGRALTPVTGVLLRGKAADLLPAIDAVGADAAADTTGPRCVKDDQALPFGIVQPTLRVSRMMVSEAGR